MPIIHVLISKNIDTVLCEYTEYQGNFNTIARNFLKKIKPNTRQTIQYDSYQYHYINKDNITYLCITSNFPEDTTFAFLMEVQRQFLNQNDYKDKRIIVPENCVETYHIDDIHPADKWNDFALENMETNGIPVVERIEE